MFNALKDENALQFQRLTYSMLINKQSRGRADSYLPLHFQCFAMPLHDMEGKGTLF